MRDIGHRKSNNPLGPATTPIAAPMTLVVVGSAATPWRKMGVRGRGQE